MNGGHIYFSSMTPREEFRLNGTLCEKTIEALIIRHEDENDLQIESAKVYVKEAKGCFPEEDFLTSIRAEIRTIANRLRGRNKDELLQLVEQLGDVESTINQQSEYGNDELKKALECLTIE